MYVLDNSLTSMAETMQVRSALLRLRTRHQQDQPPRGGEEGRSRREQELQTHKGAVPMEMKVRGRS